jgi:putative cell wall-binding protein
MLALAPTASAQGKVIVISSDNPADQAVASVWAHKIDSGVVKVPWGSLPAEGISDVVLSGASIVYVIGGELAVPNVEAALKTYDKTVIRIGGSNRMETSEGVAKRFESSRAVVLDGWDLTWMEDALTLARAEKIPLVFFHGNDSSPGAALKNAGISDITLFSNPAVDETFRDSLKELGIKVSEKSREKKIATQKMIDFAKASINETTPLVRTINDGPSLAAARLIVEAKISLAKAREGLKSRAYEEAFEQAVISEELGGYAVSIYKGIIKGRILEAVSQANSDISAQGIQIAKESLKNVGAPYGIGIPVPPIKDLKSYLVDIQGYSKTSVGGGVFYDMGAKYTKVVDGKTIFGRTVSVEIYERADETEAIKWMEQTKFTPRESGDWVLRDFNGYPANFKSIRYTITDRNNQEIFLRVAIGNLGIFSKFTESVGPNYGDLISKELAEPMVEEVTTEVIKAIENSRDS